MRPCLSCATPAAFFEKVVKVGPGHPYIGINIALPGSARGILALAGASRRARPLISATFHFAADHAHRDREAPDPRLRSRRRRLRWASYSNRLPTQPSRAHARSRRLGLLLLVTARFGIYRGSRNNAVRKVRRHRPGLARGAVERERRGEGNVDRDQHRHHQGKWLAADYVDSIDRVCVLLDRHGEGEPLRIVAGALGAWPVVRPSQVRRAVARVEQGA